MFEFVGVHLFSQVVNTLLMQVFAIALTSLKQLWFLCQSLLVTKINGCYLGNNIVATVVIHVCALLLMEQGKTLLDMCVEFWLLEQFVF